MTRSRGFTLVEVAIALAITAAVATLAWFSLERMRPRASLADTVAEVHGVLRNARQNSLSTGHYTVVMFFPQAASGRGGTGRVVVYEDATYDFFKSSAALNFGSWDASKTSGVSSLNLLGSVEFHPGISFGFGGATPPTLPAPYAAVAASACSFCSTSGDGRGAVVFDARGGARFYSANGAALSLPGATISITGFPAIPGYSMLLITPTTGAVRPFVRG